MYYSIKIFKNEKLVQRYGTKKKRLFFKKARLINWKEKPLRVYLKVYYDKGYDIWDKYVYFYNDGDYFKKKYFWLALYAFCEKD